MRDSIAKAQQLTFAKPSPMVTNLHLTHQAVHASRSKPSYTHVGLPYCGLLEEFCWIVWDGHSRHLVSVMHEKVGIVQSSRTGMGSSSYQQQKKKINIG